MFDPNGGDPAHLWHGFPTHVSDVEVEEAWIPEFYYFCIVNMGWKPMPQMTIFSPGRKADISTRRVYEDDGP